MSAFPTLEPSVRARLARRGVCPDRSLELWLGELTGRSVDQVRQLVLAGTVEAEQHETAHDRGQRGRWARAREAVAC